MGYRIQYDAMGKNIHNPKIACRRIFMTVFILCFVCLIICFCQPIQQAIVRILFPGINDEAVMKIEHLVRQIRQGIPIEEAVSAFYREIFSNVS